MKQDFLNWFYRWRPVESPPYSNNYVAEKIIKGTNRIVRRFGNTQPTPLEAIEKLCVSLNKEEA
jgi:hypothetical protein